MMLIQSKSINGAFIYNLSGEGVFSSRNTTNSIIKNASSEEWFSNALNDSNAITFLPNMKSEDIFQYTGITVAEVNVNVQQIVFSAAR